MQVHLVVSLGVCLHARVLQSWNGKFLAAFGVKFARSALKCAVAVCSAKTIY